jgi:hypothetical protein
VGGRFGLANGVTRRGAAAVSTSDGATLQWNPNIVTPNPKKAAQVGRVLDMARNSDRVYLCGDFWSVDGVVSSDLAAVDPVTGRRDSAFKANTDGGSPACQLKDGLLYVGGHFHQVGPPSGWVFKAGQKATLTGAGTATRVHLVAFNAVTGGLTSWNPGANSKLGVHWLAARRNHLAVGGDFTVIGGRAQQAFAQFADR